MKKQITCLFITPYFSPNIGGVETHFDDLLTIGEQYGVKYIVTTYQPITTGEWGAFREIKYQHLIYRLPWYGQGLFQKLEKLPFFEFIYLFPGIFFLSLFIAFKYRHTIKIVHAQGFIAGSVSVIISKLFGFKSIFSDHTLYQVKPKTLTSIIFSFIANHHDKILAVATSIKKELISWGINKNKISIFNYWANTLRFKPQSHGIIRKKLKIPLNKKILLNVSRLDPAKGLDILINTAELVFKKRKDVLFYLVNSAKTKKEFLDFINKKNLPNNCVFVGRVEYGKLSNWYAASDMLIITSRREGYTRAAVEAMLCGTPVIANNIGALIEVLPKEYSFFAPGNNPVAFCNKILNVVNNNRFKLIRKNLALYADKHFSEINGKIIFNCYRKLS